MLNQNFFMTRLEKALSRMILGKPGHLGINSLLGRNNKLNNVSALSVNENEISDSKSIAEAFNDYFINTGPKLAEEFGDEQCSNNERLVIDDANQSPHMQFKFSPILVNSVISTMRNLKLSKATGLDKTPAKILNYL